MSSSILSFSRALLSRRRPVPDLHPFRAEDRPRCKILPFATDIPVRSYLNHAFPLSIVSRYPGYKQCVYASFIQVFFPDDKLDYDRVLMLPSLCTADWERLGFLETRAIDLRDRQLSRPEAMLDFLVGHLNHGSYAEIHMDEFFLPGRPCCGKVHSVHDNMIIGYEWPEATFHLAGYGTDYEVSRVGFEDVLKAFYRAPRNQFARRYLRLIKPRDAAPRPFDLNAVVAQLTDYLQSRTSVGPEEMRKARLYWKARRFTGRWGLEAYSAFIEYIERQVSEERPLDLRVTRTLWEHKACMLARLRHLEAENVFRGGRLFSASYAPVEASARLVRFQAFEYNSRGSNPRAIADAAALLRTMRATEEAVLFDVLASLQDPRS